MSGAGVLLLSKMLNCEISLTILFYFLISRLVIIWIHDFLLTLTVRNNFLKLFEIKLNILHCRNVGISFHTNLFIQRALDQQEGFLSFSFLFHVERDHAEDKDKVQRPSVTSALWALWPSSVSHFSSVCFASAFCVWDALWDFLTHTRAKFSRHAIIPVIDPSGSTVPCSLCRLLQTRPASGKQLAPWRLRHALLAVFIERHHRDYLCLILGLITPYITFPFCNPESGILRWHSKRLLLASNLRFSCIWLRVIVELRVSCSATRPGNKQLHLAAVQPWRGKKKKQRNLMTCFSLCFLRWWVRSWIPSIPCLSPSSSWAGVCRAPEAVKSWCVNCFYTSHLIFSLWSFLLQWPCSEAPLITLSWQPHPKSFARVIRCIVLSYLFLLILLCGRA